MPRTTRILTSTALALILLNVPAFAQDDNNGQAKAGTETQAEAGTEAAADATKGAAAEAGADAGAAAEAGTEAETAAPVIEAYQVYATAYANLQAAAQSGGDVDAALKAAKDAKSGLKDACSTAGQDKLSACLDALVPQGMRIGNDLQSLDKVVAAAAPAENADAKKTNGNANGGGNGGGKKQSGQAEDQTEQTAGDQQTDQSVEASGDQQGGSDQQAADAAPDDNAAADAGADQQAADEAPADNTAAAADTGNDQAASSEDSSSGQSSDESAAADESGGNGDAAAGTEQSSDQQAPSGEDAGAENGDKSIIDNVTDGVKAAADAVTGGGDEAEGAAVADAYTAYADARASLQRAQDEGGDTASAVEEVNARFDAVNAACADLGVALEECLDTYVSADMRVENDLQPMQMPEAGSNEAAADNQDQAASDEGGNGAAASDESGGEQSSDEISPDQEPVSDEELSEDNVNPEDVAPVLDSAKEGENANAEASGDEQTTNEADQSGDQQDQAASDESGQNGDQSGGQQAGQGQNEKPQAAPESDAQAQAGVRSEQIESVKAEQGQEIDAQEGRKRARHQQVPDNAEVVEQNDFRIVFRINNQLVVRNRDNDRIGRDAKDRSYEQLDNGMLRETIVRQDGTQVITIYAQNGEIYRRSLIQPDGSEYVLVYTPDQERNDPNQWQDPGRNLPPFRLNIPANQYVLDARSADEQHVSQFLGQPPLENVRRLYSVDEVKRSARLRDTMRRLEITNLTFDTGSAALSADQFGSLQIVAQAMLDLLSRNPAEIFLIEGHTDAVGSDVANLDLSDRRAETVAIVLTETFGVPPENLTTQGYGERFLKVDTQGPSRLNRRVTVKRITPLVSPSMAGR